MEVTLAKKARRAVTESPWRKHARETLEKMRDELRSKVGWDEVVTNPDGTQTTTHHRGSLVEAIDAESRSEPAYYENPALYWRIVLSYALVHLAIGIPTLIFLTSVVTEVGGITINVGLTVLLLQLAHVLGSIRSIGVDDLAGIDFFGRPVKHVGPGLKFVPWLLLTLTVVRRPYLDVRFPGRPDTIYRTSTELQEKLLGGDIPKEGTVRPILVTTGEPKKITAEEREELGRTNPLDQQLNIEISYFVRYRPNQEAGGIFRIARNLARGGKIDERVRDLVREQSERDIKAILATQTTASLIENLALVNEVFTLRIQEAILRLGIQVDSRGAGLADVNPSHKTNEAQAEAARERFRRAQKILQAEAAAITEQLRLEALAKGYKAIAKATDTDGNAILASETAKAALSEKADTIVLGSEGMAQLLGLVRAGQSMLGRTGQAGTPTTTSTP